MASAALGTVLRHLRKLAPTPASEAVTDLHLLRRFTAARDEDSFAELVRRHGPLVLSVCRRVLVHEQDAEDAFQAAFLVLARKAGSIRKGESVGSFLYGVAYRIAMKERSRLVRQHNRERRVEQRLPASPEHEAAWRELQGLLDDGLQRLPEKYRSAFLLCCLQGKSKSEAARELGCKEGTLSSRLARARQELQELLARKGVTLAVALAAAGVTESAASACVPPTLAAVCVRAALRFTVGPSLALEAGKAARLAEAALGSMTALRWKVATVLLLSACLAVGGTGPEPPGQAKSAPVSGPQKPLEAEGKGPRDRYGDALPEGALARLGTVRYHFSSVASAFLPDGKTVVSCGQGGIKLWEARTGRLLREIDTDTLTFSGVGGSGGFALSADGKRLALSGSVQGDGKPGWRPAAAVFDLATGKAIRTIERHPLEGIHALTMSPDGKMLFTLDRKGKLRVEEVATGAELLRQQLPGDVIASLAISPDGSTLALGSGPNTHKIFVWRWQAAEEPRQVASGWHRGHMVAFSPDGKLLAECSDAQPDVRLVEVASGRLLRKLELPDHEPYRHYNLAFAPNGRLLAAFGGSNDRSAAHLWNPATGAFVKRLPLGGDLAFSPDSSLLVAGSEVWDLATGKNLAANGEAHRGAIEHVVTGPKDLVVTAGDDNTIRVWEAATGKQRVRMAQDSLTDMSIRALALSADGTHLVTSSMRDDQVSLWDMATGKRIYRLPGHGRLGSAAAAAVFLPDGKSFLTWGGADMCLRKWDVRTGKALVEHVIRPAGIPVPSEDDEPINRGLRFLSIGGAHFTADARCLVFHAGRKWYVFDADTGQPLRSFPGGENLTIGTTVSPDGKLLLASGYGRATEIKLPGGGMQSSLPKTHPLTLWSLATGEVQREITLPEKTPGPVAFSADGKLFAVASSGPGTHLRVLETDTGRTVRKIEGFRGSVRSLAFMLDGKRLVSGMEDGSALVWDLVGHR